MKILVLSQLEGSPGTEIFLRAARAAGHEARLENPLHARIFLGDHQAIIKGIGDLDVDIVFTRMGSATPERGFDVLRQLELSGLVCVNQSGALRITRDKLRSYFELGAAGLPLPPTIVASGSASASELAAELGPPPWVWKQPVGTKGQAIERVDSIPELHKLLARENRFLLQAFVGEAEGSDIRVLVVGGRAIAAIRRVAKPGEWRSNLYLGGATQPQELSAEMVSIAERAAATLRLGVAGVDLLPSSQGLLIAEVNGSPGLVGTHLAFGDEPAKGIVRLLESRVCE